MGNNLLKNNQEFQAQCSTAAKVAVYGSFILLLPVVLFISKRNWFLKMQEDINEVASNIDIQLKKRFDLLVKLVDSTKEYMKYEKETLNQITALRSQKNANAGDLSKYQANLSSVSDRINVSLEAYPDLKANNSVIQLQKASKDVEDNIAAARRFYNATVVRYNSSLKMFPGNVVATGLGLSSFLYFEITDAQRADVKISF